jgi:hypothetical protein
MVTNFASHAGTLGISETTQKKASHKQKTFSIVTQAHKQKT